MRNARRSLCLDFNNWSSGNSYRSCNFQRFQSQNAGGLLIGVLYDRIGTSVSRLVAWLMMTVGLVLLAFIVEINWLAYPGLVLYIAGGFSLVQTNFPLGQLFPSFRALIMTLSFSTYSLSGSTFRLGLFTLNYSP